MRCNGFRLAAIIGAGSAMAAIAGCGDGGNEPAAPGQVAIEVGNNFFDPDSRSISAGATVVWTWTNTGQISHSVESTGSPGFPSSTTKSGNGQSHSHRFSAAGTYTYQCAVHGAGMSGTIVVQ